MVGSAIYSELSKKGFTNIITARKSELQLTNFSSVNKFINFHKPEIIINAAGLVGGIMENIRIPAELMIKNMSIQNNVIISASNINIEKLFFFGSSCMYPKKSRNPIGEKALYSGLLEETSKPYAIAKLAGTELCLSLNKQNNNTKLNRITDVLGKDAEENNNNLLFYIYDNGTIEKK